MGAPRKPPVNRAPCERGVQTEPPSGLSWPQDSRMMGPRLWGLPWGLGEGFLQLFHGPNRQCVGRGLRNFLWCHLPAARPPDQQAQRTRGGMEQPPSQLTRGPTGRDTWEMQLGVLGGQGCQAQKEDTDLLNKDSHSCPAFTLCLLPRGELPVPRVGPSSGWAPRPKSSSQRH